MTQIGFCTTNRVWRCDQRLGGLKPQLNLDVYNVNLLFLDYCHLF